MTYVETAIAPALASEWLTKYPNPNNRPLDLGAVSRYATDMATGNWTPSGQTIQFTTKDDGTPMISDGQHRLRAIVDSGTTQTIMVVWNVPQIAMLNTDGGKSRTKGQNLRMCGKTYAATYAAVVQPIVNMSVNGGAPVKLSASQTESLVNQYASSINAIAPHFGPQRGVDKKLRSRSLMAPFVYAHHNADPIDQPAVEEMAKLFVSGAYSFPKDHPIRATRDHMSSGAVHLSGADNVPKNFKKLLTGIRAYLENETINELRVTDKGWNYFTK